MMLARIDAAVDLGNRLHLGENLNGLRLLAKSNTRVDLVYIDPPYGTSRRGYEPARGNERSIAGQTRVGKREWSLCVDALLLTGH